MRKNRRNFKKEATREPYELELDDAPEEHSGVIVFKDPGGLETHSAFDLDLMRPNEVFQLLLSEEDYNAWWNEWRNYPIRETNALLTDVQKHYGADQGKLPR